jgi:hypothetical protein
MQHEPIISIDELDSWTRSLTRIAAEPLEFCPRFPQIARRFDAWWNQSVLDRPIFIGQVNANPKRPITRRLELLAEPEAWLRAKQADMVQTHRVGDALPGIRVDFGPVMLGGLFGAKVEFQSDTTWTHAYIDDDWSNAPEWRIRDEEPWWVLLRRLTRMVAEDAAGRYLVRTPDLGGSADVLLNLRGSSPLCMDVIEQPQRLIDAQSAIYPSWRQVFCELYRLCLSANAGISHWLELWSSRPHHVPACDFNFMIGPDDFERVCLPDIARQCATVGQACFHLDGSGAARHIDALLEAPCLQAIQFTPGAGTPSALAWVEMLRKIQDKGRSVLVFCPPGEVLELSRMLRPEGLAIFVLGAIGVGELDELFRQFGRRFGGGG